VQRSEEAYLAWQLMETIRRELEDGASEASESERGVSVSSHVELCQRPHVTNGSGQRRQAVHRELRRRVSNDT
jgi:hypothetical protein